MCIMQLRLWRYACASTCMLQGAHMLTWLDVSRVQDFVVAGRDRVVTTFTRNTTSTQEIPTTPKDLQVRWATLRQLLH